MKYTFNSTEKMLALSVGFTMVLLAFRIFFSETLNYIFYAWNLFLALVPLLFSRKLQHHSQFSSVSIGLLLGWLLFFPNAPYVITDIFHFKERLPVPKWYDLLLVTSAAWNGMILGFISLLQVEQFLSRQFSRIKVGTMICCFVFLCGYGIYIGRYMRYNSWDIITDPFRLIDETSDHFLNPIQHFRVWEFTLLFSVMLIIIYATLRHLSTNTLIKPEQKS